jgi:predicted O-methyltransferase YrrM
MSELMSDDVARYLELLVPERAAEMQRMEAHARATSFPIIGAAAGWYCYVMARMIGARSVFELGSGFGYSTAWFARAVVENGGGIVHHVVWDDGLSRQAREHLTTLGYANTVRFHVAEAVETLRSQDTQFDLIFNDIDKQGYPASLEVIREKLRVGGVLITDNALWHGRIFKEGDLSPATEGVRQLTRALQSSDEWATTLVPIRDGLLVALKTR